MDDIAIKERTIVMCLKAGDDSICIGDECPLYARCFGEEKGK